MYHCSWPSATGVLYWPWLMAFGAKRLKSRLESDERHVVDGAFGEHRSSRYVRRRMGGMHFIIFDFDSLNRTGELALRTIDQLDPKEM